MIVMIAVLSAMVVPSVSNISNGSVADESNRLKLIMRLAAEETQLSGVPLRWLATKDGWSFESLEQVEGGFAWFAYDVPPLAKYALPAGILIEAVDQAGEFSLDMEVKAPEREEEAEVIIGLVMFLPDGTVSQSNIKLSGEAGDSKVLEVRPGPAGIRLLKDEAAG